MLKITLGDYAVLVLTAKSGDDPSLPIDLTGATFETQIRGPGGDVVTFANSKHQADPDQVTNTGVFRLTLNATDTASLAAGPHREILTKITLSAQPIYYHGFDVLEVLENVPLQ